MIRSLLTVALGATLHPVLAFAQGKPHVQKETIVVDNGFNPASISVKAGQPVQITFITKHKDCISSVVFENPKMRKALKDGTKTVMSFTPKKPGTYAFACPMGMRRGEIVAK